SPFGSNSRLDERPRARSAISRAPGRASKTRPDVQRRYVPLRPSDGTARGNTTSGDTAAGGTAIGGTTTGDTHPVPASPRAGQGTRSPVSGGGGRGRVTRRCQHRAKGEHLGHYHQQQHR